MSQILDQKGLMLNGQIVDDNDLVLLRNGIELAKTSKILRNKGGVKFE